MANTQVPMAHMEIIVWHFWKRVLGFESVACPTRDQIGVVAHVVTNLSILWGITWKSCKWPMDGPGHVLACNYERLIRLDFFFWNLIDRESRSGDGERRRPSHTDTQHRPQQIRRRHTEHTRSKHGIKHNGRRNHNQDQERYQGREETEHKRAPGPQPNTSKDTSMHQPSTTAR